MTESARKVLGFLAANLMVHKEAHEAMPPTAGAHQPMILSLETIQRMERDKDTLERLAGYKSPIVLLTLPAALYLIQESQK